MWVDPFWLGFLVGLIASIGALLTLAYYSGRRKK
jgi:hypothetical protein